MAKREKITALDLPALLRELECGDATQQKDVLRRLCPCRSRCYAPEAWIEIYHLYNSMEPEPVRHQAKHAIDTLLERARSDAVAKELLESLAERGVFLSDRADNDRRAKQDSKVNLRDVPRLLEILNGDDPEAQQYALRQLCPCRNRCYDRQVWLTMFRLYETAEHIRVRDQARHAIDTLRDRARIDPRSQELLRWLSAQGVTGFPTRPPTPRWNPHAPRGKQGLSLSRKGRSQRSKANRQR